LLVCIVTDYDNHILFLIIIHFFSHKTKLYKYKVIQIQSYTNTKLYKYYIKCI